MVATVVAPWPNVADCFDAGCKKAIAPEEDFPTFVKAIRRQKPPSAPAGLEWCDSPTIEQWKGDEMRYPP